MSVVTCSVCGGSGLARLSTPCPRCGGYGYQGPPLPPFVCSQCHGRGAEVAPCTNCWGTGRMYQADPPRPIEIPPLVPTSAAPVIPIIPSLKMTTGASPLQLPKPWIAGKEHPQHPHVVAAPTEGKWRPAFGYRWVYPNDNNDWQVVWSPGKEHPQHPHVVAAATEGHWRPASGYDWVYPNNPNDLAVTPVK